MSRGNALAVSFASVLTLLTAIHTPTLADSFFDGNALHDFCTSGRKGDRLIVRGYATGVADEQGMKMGIIDDATGSSVMPRKFVCLPVGVTGNQAEDVACHYLSNHPEIETTARLCPCFSALLEAWPSKR